MIHRQARAAHRRVLILSAFHPELRHGGSQRVAYDLFRELLERQDVEAIFLAALDDRQSALLPSAVPITAFEGRRDEHLFRAADYDPVWQKLCSTVAIDALCEFLLFHRPDIVHLHHYVFFGIDMLSIVRRLLPNAAIVLTLHDFGVICPANGYMVRTVDRSLCDRASAVRCHQCLPERKPNHFEQRRLWFLHHLETADALACPSRFLLDRHVAWGIARERLHHIPNGISVAPPSPTPVARRVCRFGFFGQLIDIKGLGLLLRAISLLRDEGLTAFTVEINGDNLASASASLRAEFESFMREELLRPRAEQVVIENGPYDHDQLGGRMARVDWCIVPSIWWEAFALVISEAWSFGKPVICSDVGAMSERVTHERDGLLFATGDAEQLAGSMRRAITESDLCARLHANLPAVATRADMASAYLDLYESVSRQPEMAK